MAIQIIGDSPFNGTPKSVKAKVSNLPGSLPTTQIPAGVDVEEIARSQLPHLLSLSREDLIDSAIWRDSLALTGTFRTFYSAKSVAEAWKTTFNHQSATNLTLVPNTARPFKVLDVSSWIDADFTFKTGLGGPQHLCSGIISFAFDGNKEWKIWMIRTILEDIEGYGNVDVLDPVMSPGAVEVTTNGVNERSNVQHKDENIQHFDVIVVGGGQAGLGVGGRLQALSTSYLVIDKFEAVGDSWDSRYDSTKRELPLQYCCGPKSNPEAVHTAREFGKCGTSCENHWF